MFRRFSLDFALLSMLLDALVVGVALVVAAYFRAAIKHSTNRSRYSRT
jgi:hypothetical protein